MASLRLASVLAISASCTAISACTVEEVVVPGSTGSSGDPAASGDPLDTAPEGDPICTREGYCWDFPYTPSSFAALHASTPNALWAVGTSGTILRSHSRGQAWRLMPTGVMSDLHGVFAIDHHHAWAVGADGMLLSFDGAQWTRVPVPVESSSVLRSVWAASASDVWAVGSEMDSKTEREIGIVLHFDGNRWTRLSNPFTPLYAVHGKGKEVWIAGGSAEGPSVMRWDGLTFLDVDTIALAGSRSVYGPAIGLWVNDRYDVLLTSGRINTSTIARYTGEWTVERNQRHDRAPLGGFGRGPDGAPLVVGDPPLKSDGAGKWVPIAEKSYAGVNAIWAVDEEVTVFAGRDGLLDTSGDGQQRPENILPTNLESGWALADDGMYEFDATARRWTHPVVPSADYDWDEWFIDAVQTSENDILVTSALYYRDGEGGQVPARFRTRQWDGKTWTTGALPENGNYSRHGVAKTKAGDVWIAQPGINATALRRSKGGGEAPLGRCAGDTSDVPSTSFVWTAGDDVFFWGYRGIYRVAPNGSCTMTPLATAVGTGQGFVTAHAIAPNDVWLVTKATDSTSSETVTSNVFRFDGASWRKVSTKSQEVLSVRVLEGGGTFVLGKKTLMTWNGTSLVDVETGLHEKESSLVGMWGKTASDAKFVGPGGRILARKKTN